jgi:hypothetical protein
VPSRACSCFRLKLTSARALASFEFDTITSVYRIADYVTAISPAIDGGKTLLFNGGGAESCYGAVVMVAIVEAGGEIDIGGVVVESTHAFSGAGAG